MMTSSPALLKKPGRRHAGFFFDHAPARAWGVTFVGGGSCGIPFLGAALEHFQLFASNRCATVRFLPIRVTQVQGVRRKRVLAGNRNWLTTVWDLRIIRATLGQCQLQAALHFLH